MTGGLGQRRPHLTSAATLYWAGAPRATRGDKQCRPAGTHDSRHRTTCALPCSTWTTPLSIGRARLMVGHAPSPRVGGWGPKPSMFSATLTTTASRRAQEVFAAARRHLHLPETVEELVSQYRSEYPEMFRPDDAVLAALRRLRARRWRLGIVTNGPATQHEK